MAIQYGSIALALALSACTHVADIPSNRVSVDECSAKSSKILKGQIEYFEGMTLKVPNCKIYYSSEFDFKPDKAIRKVLDQIDYGLRTKPQYIDITFTGYTNRKGKLIIESVDFAKVSNNVIF